MEIEVVFTDPRNKQHHTIVTTGVELLTPEAINRLVFRAGRNIIYTPSCIYSGTQIKAKKFRVRSLDTASKRVGDYFWTIKKTYSAWSKWYDYGKFYDQCFSEPVVTRTVVVTSQPRRHD